MGRPLFWCARWTHMRNNRLLEAKLQAFGVVTEKLEID